MRYTARVVGPIALIGMALMLAGCSGAPTSARATPAANRTIITSAAKPTQSAAVVVSTTSAPPTALKLATPIVLPSEAAKAQSLEPCHSGLIGDSPLALVRGTNGQGLWIRSDPAGDPIDVVMEGAHLALAGEACLADGRWWTQVQTPDGLTGWAAIDYLGPDGDEVAATTATLPPTSARNGTSSTTTSAQAAATPTPKPAPPAPTKTPVPTTQAAPPATATPAPTRKPTMAPTDFPPVSQLDPLLRPGYQALVTLPKIGPAFGEMVKKAHVRLAVGETPGAWAQFEGLSKVITVDSKTIKDDPRAIAAVLAHEITHATQTARGEDCTLARELEAHKVGINVWESFWENQTPPKRTQLEAELGEWLVRLREGGDPGMVAHLRQGYPDICVERPG